MLNNNAVYFGNLQGLGSQSPVLTAVYYVEWHGLDRTVINEKPIVFLEPVGPDSKVDQVINLSGSACGRSNNA